MIHLRVIRIGKVFVIVSLVSGKFKVKKIKISKKKYLIHLV